MSQAGEIDVIATHPEIPTEFVANTGSAIPIANVLEILGTSVAAASTPLKTSASGKTVTIQVQRASSSASTDATKSGIAHFDSAAFSVDANGFVQLVGGGLAMDSIHPDSGTDPVVPTPAGLVNILGSGSLTTVGSLNTLTVQLTGLTNHALLIGAGTSTITKLASGTTGQVLQTNTGADPSWSTATYPSTAGTSGNVLTSDGTNWTSAAPGLILIQAQDASASATIDFTTSGIGSTWMKMLLSFRGVVPGTDNASLLMQMSNDGGATWKSTGYLAGINTFPYNATTLTNTNSTASWILSGTLDNGDSASLAAGDINIYCTVANQAYISGNISYFGNTSSLPKFGTVGGKTGNNGLNAIRLIMDSGTIASGRFYLYGYRES